MKNLNVHPIRTEIYHDGDLVEFITSSVPQSLIQEKMVLAITSKIVSLAEGRIVSRLDSSKEYLANLAHW